MEQTQQNHFTALFYKNVLLGILSMAALRCFRPRLRKKKSKKPISILV